MSFIFEPIKLLIVNNNIPNNSKIKQSNNEQKIENESENNKKMNNFFIKNPKIKKKLEHNKDDNYFNKTEETNLIKRGLKRQYSSHSNIVCVDTDSQKNELKNNEKDNAIIFKRNIKEINNELKSDSIDNKKKRNYIGFQLKEKNILKRKGDEGGGNISLLKIHKNGSYKPINTYKYILNLKRKTEDENLLKIPIKGIKTKIFEEKLNKSQIINIKIKDYKNVKNEETKKIVMEEYKNEINNKNENIDKDKDEIIKNLKSENDNLKKVANENHSLF